MFDTNTHTEKKKGNFHLCPPTLPYSRREPSFLFTRKRNWLPPSQSLFWNLLIILLLLPLLLPGPSPALISLCPQILCCAQKGPETSKFVSSQKEKKKQVERENGGFVDLWMKKTRQIIKKIKLFRVYIPAKSQGLLRKSDNRKGNAHHVGGALKMRL